MLVWSGVGDKPDSSENPSGLDGWAASRHSFSFSYQNDPPGSHLLPPRH